MSTETTALSLLHEDDINDAVLAGIAASLDAGLCWACQRPAHMEHAPHCPEKNQPIPTI